MFNLDAMEIVIIAVVAILIFGQRLPQVAAEFGGWLVKLRRSMNDLRRESGIDREIMEVRRQVENAVPREVRNFDPKRSLEKGARELERQVAGPVVEGVGAVREALSETRREPASSTPEGAPVTPRADPEAPQAPPAGTDPRP